MIDSFLKVRQEILWVTSDPWLRKSYQCFEVKFCNLARNRYFSDKI